MEVLVRKVESELFRDRTIPKGPITINADRGIVVLRGQLEDAQQIQRIEREVRGVAGVRDVEVVGMPLAAVVWPVVPWVARAAMRAFAVCLIVPVLWALCFAAGGATMLNAISFNAPTVLNTLLQPLVAIVLLYVMPRAPRARR